MKIGVVAIGRNEGDRLRACLASARRVCAAVVYVDSGSTDDSVEIAGSLGVSVVDLKPPFSAARARNLGFARLREIEPALDAVQFVDGDCEIVSGWIEKATAELAADPKAAVVCGRRRERFPEKTIYNRLCDLEWDTPVGIAKACGGDAMIRMTALEQSGGYNPTVIAGEEPEMCLRLRQLGWTIHRIDAEMTLHDAAITRFDQWWKRQVRAGHAYAQANCMHGEAPEYFRRREVLSIQRWAIFPVFFSLLGVCLVALLAPKWWFFGLCPLLLYPVQAVRIASQRTARGTLVTQALLYGGSLMLGKFPQWLGVCRFRSRQQRGERSAIIEYKN